MGALVEVHVDLTRQKNHRHRICYCDNCEVTIILIPHWRSSPFLSFEF